MSGGESIQRIVAAVDLSGLRRRVADRARLIAEEHHASLTLLHAIPPVSDVFLSDAELRAMKLLRRDSTENLAAWLRERTDIPIDIRLPEGPPARAVAREARDADLIVAGTSSIDPSSLGPMTLRIARKSRANLVAVRRQPRVPYRRVVVGVDLSDASRRAVEVALDVALGADVTVLYSLPLRFDALLSEAGLGDAELTASRTRRMADAEEALARFVEPWGERLRPLVIDGPPGDAIGEVVRRRGADLTVVASRGASEDSMVLLGTVAENVLATAPCDVLLAHVGGVFRRP